MIELLCYIDVVGYFNIIERVGFNSVFFRWLQYTSYSWPSFMLIIFEFNEGVFIILSLGSANSRGYFVFYLIILSHKCYSSSI